VKGADVRGGRTATSHPECVLQKTTTSWAPEEKEVTPPCPSETSPGPVQHRLRSAPSSRYVIRTASVPTPQSISSVAKAGAAGSTRLNATAAMAPNAGFLSRLFIVVVPSGRGFDGTEL
jgi:hypothetical protein